MKSLILIILVVLLPLTSAVKVNIFLNQSYSKDGRNVTLVDLTKDKALICINNEKAIISKDKLKTIKDVSLELKNIYPDKIRVDVKVYCKDCVCGNSCNNIDCVSFDHKDIQKDILKEETEDQINSENSIETEVIQNNSKTNFSSLLGAIIIIVILISALYFLIKKD